MIGRLESSFEAVHAELRKTRRVMLLGFAALAVLYAARLLRGGTQAPRSLRAAREARKRP